VIYQLPSGKCIEISIDYFLSLTDEQIIEYANQDYGLITENPWKIKTGVELLSEEDLVEEGRFVSLDKYTTEEKFNDEEYQNLDDV
jgi:hypothetical protein